MLSLKKPAQRYSLCLLDEGEDYVGLWLGTCRWPKTVAGNWQCLDQLAGNIRLCSKSLFFEPDDARIPIVRLPYKAMQSLEASGKRGFSLVTTQILKMKANMVDAPYIVEKGKPSHWEFSLVYGQMSEVLPSIHQYLAASRLSHYDRQDALELLALERAKAAIFDTSQLLDFTERSIYDQPATQHTPLVKELGRLIVTDKRLYFQALNNVGGGSLVNSHPLSGIAAIARRRSALQPLGLEVFFVEPEKDRAPLWGAASAFFAFTSEIERENVFELITQQLEFGTGLPGRKSAAIAGTKTLEAGTERLKAVTQAWQAGQISNFDYLLFCNIASGRSFSDLTQYCVFPWIIADYESETLDLDSKDTFRDLSLPMGAIDPQRLSVLLKRYREMPREEGMDKPFLYGTHYSCPGYVMFWLVRAAPGHLLRLQNGRFDSADRLFISIGDSYQSATSAPADIKELIPEFFMSDTTFLKNGEQLALGSRQNGMPVGDVELPAWAQSPQDFLLKHRAALESPFVSANLHHWLDLIFGVKQKGDAAERANNVFHHLTYEGAVDITQVSDKRERHAIECQINEFGQCPRQIFSAPHPRRLDGPNSAEAFELAQSEMGNKRLSSGGDESQSISLTLLHTILAAISSNSNNINPAKEVNSSFASLDVGDEKPSDKEDTRGKIRDLSIEESVNPLSESGQTSEVSNTTRRSSSDRLKEGLNTMGGQISSMVNTFAQNPKGSIKSAPQFAQSRLKGLFQRPPSGKSLPKAEKRAVDTDSKDQRLLQSSGASDKTDRKLETASISRDDMQASQNGLAEPSSAVKGSERSEEADQNQISESLALDPREDLAAQELAEALNDISIASPVTTTLHNDNLAKYSESEPPQSTAKRKRSPGFWGEDLIRALQKEPSRIKTANARINAIACIQEGDDILICCALQSGSLRIYNGSTGVQVRSVSLSTMPLTSILILPGKSPNSSVILSGGFDNQVHAYSMEYGNVLGNFVAHDDTVSCLLEDEDLLLTSSHDGALKAWSLDPGSEPWSTPGTSPAICIESDMKVICMDSNEGIVVLGSEDGEIEGWKLSTQERLWQVQVSSGEVSSISVLLGGDLCIVTAISGQISLLDVTECGSILCEIESDESLTCGLTDGKVLLTGYKDSEIQMHELNGSGANAVLRDYHLLEFKFPREFRVRRMTCTTGPGKFCLAFELADGQILVYK